MFDAGPIAGPRWFPHADAGGLDVTLDAGYALRPLELVLGTRYERYFFSLNPDASGDNPGGIAAGAVDAYVTVYAGVRFSLSRRGLSRQ
jgi:hypothetical protein